MIIHNLKTFGFICIVFATLQTGYTIQENCLKYNKELSCKENGVEFFLRSEKNTGFHELISLQPETFEKADFLPTKIKFIIHGHSEKKDDPIVTPLQEEYLKLKYNVLLINYTQLSEDTGDKRCYRTGVENSIMISECAAKIILDIIEHKKRKIQDFHILGLSLGGQMAGQIPNILKGKIDGTISRITGIDPAGDGFFEDYDSDKYTLTKFDADLVDVIHSNAGINGKLLPMGHYDWYANWGIFQPECPIGKYDNPAKKPMYLCDHIRSVILFLESIGDPNFTIETEWCANLEMKFLTPQSCEKVSAVPFGENLVKGKIKEGVHFFNTKNTFPYMRPSANTNYRIYKLHLILESILYP